MVARAWTDPDFRQLLLTDGTAAVAQYGYLGPQANTSWQSKTPRPQERDRVLAVFMHRVAHPRSAADLVQEFRIRARVVREPRKVLSEMGTEIASDVEIRVYDTTAETRYMVLPQRPAGTEGWSQEQLQEIVTKDCLIGVAVPQVPTV